MVYLKKKFTLLDEIQEHNIEFNEERRNIFNNNYPLHLFSSKSFKEINFDKITIFYGGNGSGKNNSYKYDFTKIKCIKEVANRYRFIF